MKLLYLSPVRFNSFSQRPQKFLEWSLEGIFETALWVEPYPTRLPTFADFYRKPSKKYIKNIDQRLSIINIRALPIEPIYLLRWLNIIFWLMPLLFIKNYCENNRVILVIAKPSLFGFILCKLIKFEMVIYDAMDDFPSFYKGVSKNSMMKFESKTISNSNIILASSTAIFNKIKKIGGFAIFIPNAMDASSLPKITLKKNKKDNVYGYIGTIGPWFDWEFIKQIARMRPHSEIRIIGPVLIDLKDPPNNVKIIPECSHEDAILEMSKLDIALIPFLRTSLTKSVDPIKYYEYKSLGLPIISTSFGEMSFRASEEGVYICGSISELALALDKADLWKYEVDEISKFRVENSWTIRFNTLLDFFKK